MQGEGGRPDSCRYRGDGFEERWRGVESWGAGVILGSQCQGKPVTGRGSRQKAGHLRDELRAVIRKSVPRVNLWTWGLGGGECSDGASEQTQGSKLPPAFRTLRFLSPCWGTCWSLWLRHARHPTCPDLQSHPGRPGPLLPDDRCVPPNLPARSFTSSPPTAGTCLTFPCPCPLEPLSSCRTLGEEKLLSVVAEWKCPALGK